MNIKRKPTFTEWFTQREQELMDQVRAKHLTLPERLNNWPLWIQDPVIYINELHNLVDTAH